MNMVGNSTLVSIMCLSFLPYKRDGVPAIYPFLSISLQPYNGDSTATARSILRFCDVTFVSSQGFVLSDELWSFAHNGTFVPLTFLFFTPSFIVVLRRHLRVVADICALRIEFDHAGCELCRYPYGRRAHASKNASVHFSRTFGSNLGDLLENQFITWHHEENHAVAGIRTRVYSLGSCSPTTRLQPHPEGNMQKWF